MTTEQLILGNIACGIISAIIVLLTLWKIPEPFKTDGLFRRIGTIVIAFITGYVSLFAFSCLFFISLYVNTRTKRSLGKLK